MQTFRYVAKNTKTGRLLFDNKEKRILRFMTIAEVNEYLVSHNLNVLEYELSMATANKLADLNTTELVTRGLL